MYNLLSATNGSTNLLITVAYVAIIVGGMYFLMIRPQKKKSKQEEAMRKNVKVGDEITTIGGIVGRVVSIKEDMDSIIIETGVDRNLVQLKRWAIASNDTALEEAKKEEAKK